MRNFLALVAAAVILGACALCPRPTLAWGGYRHDPYDSEEATRLESLVCLDPGEAICLSEWTVLAARPCRRGEITGLWKCPARWATPTPEQVAGGLEPGAWFTVRACGENGCSEMAMCGDSWCVHEGGPVTCYGPDPAGFGGIVEVPCN